MAENIETTEKTLTQLKAELVELGLPQEQADKFSSKPQAQATIDLLKSKEAIAVANAPVIQTPNGLDVAGVSEVDKVIEDGYIAKKERMRIQLEAQPLVSVIVPKEPKEQPGRVDWIINPRTGVREQKYISGAIQTVTLNGYIYLVPKGVYTKVPEQVSQIIMDKEQQTNDAGKDFLIDRPDTELGGTVADRL